MFGLNEAQYNAVKGAAKRLASEMKDAIKLDKKTYDQIATLMIDRHYRDVKTLVSRSQFIWIAGYLEGRFGRKYFDYE